MVIVGFTIKPCVYLPYCDNNDQSFSRFCQTLIDHKLWSTTIMMPTLCVSSATSFSQLATSLSCADTFFGSFCNHHDDVDHGDGAVDDDDVDAVDNLH